jgi:hypothetical protein
LFIVAESRYLAANSASPLDLCSSLDVAVQLDLRYHFSGPLCASYWIDLCRCRDYGHDRVVGAVESALPAVVAVLRDRLPPAMPLALLSLGPGDGEVDSRVLDWFRPQVDVSAYRCVDFSFEMLEFAVRRLRASGAATGLPISAVCADFSEMDSWPAPGGDASLWLLTGYTLGNLNESVLLSNLSRRMQEGDCLLLDAHLHPFGLRNGDFTDEEQRMLVRGYDNPATSRFAFGPVETVTTAVPDDVSFGQKVGQFVTTVPGAANVVIGCAGLDARMRLTGQPARREYLDLCATTLYDFDALCEWFRVSPLELLLASRHGDTGVFLLQKRA